MTECHGYLMNNSNVLTVALLFTSHFEGKCSLMLPVMVHNPWGVTLTTECLFVFTVISGSVPRKFVFRCHCWLTLLLNAHLREKLSASTKKPSSSDEHDGHPTYSFNHKLTTTLPTCYMYTGYCTTAHHLSFTQIHHHEHTINTTFQSLEWLFPCHDANICFWISQCALTFCFKMLIKCLEVHHMMT